MNYPEKLDYEKLGLKSKGVYFDVWWKKNRNTFVFLGIDLKKNRWKLDSL